MVYTPFRVIVTVPFSSSQVAEIERRARAAWIIESTSTRVIGNGVFIALGWIPWEPHELLRYCPVELLNPKGWFSIFYTMSDVMFTTVASTRTNPNR